MPTRPTLHSSVFRKSLIIVLLITCLPTAFIGSTLYFIGVNRIEAEVNKTYQLRLNQVSKQFENGLSELEVRMTQWVFNPVFEGDLGNTNFASEVTFTRDLLKTLFIMQETNPLIDEVYLYVEENKTLISSLQGVRVIDQSDEAFGRFYQKLASENKKMIWSKALPLPDGMNSRTTQNQFSYSMALKIADQGLIIIRLNTAKLMDYFDELDSGFAFLLDDKGDWLIRTNPGNASSDSLEHLLQQEVMKHWKDQKENTFTASIGSAKYSVSYYTSSRLGTNWIFAITSDISKVFEPVIVMSRLIVFISGAGVLAAILLSWVASRKLYQPIGRLLNAITKDRAGQEAAHTDELRFIEAEWQHLSRESRMLQSRVEEHLPTLRDGFMLQLVQGRLYFLNEAELRSRVEYYGWNPHDHQFTALVVQLYGLLNADGKFKEDDEQLVTFAAANMMEELAKLHLEQAHVINFQDLTVGIVAAMPLSAGKDSVKAELTRLAHEIISTLNSILKLQVTVCIGNLSGELGQIPEMIEDVRRTLRFRNLTEANQVIHIEDVLIKGDFTFRYPFHLEKEIIHAIRLGEEETALRKTEEFTGELEKTAGVELFVQQAMIQLVGNINNALLQAGYNVYLFQEDRNAYEELIQLRQTDEILKWFRHSIIIPYVREMNETYHAQLTHTVEKVVQLVDERYMTDLSLEECADLLQVNVSSLSKSFKQIKGLNYVDYVTKVRIDTSKKLLLETELKISEIAEKVGYQHSWYNRVFKKYEGITPSQFREEHMK